MEVELLVIGDEILSGKILDKNGPFAANFLQEKGFLINKIHILGDDPKNLTSQITEIMDRAQVLITSGGLGPTQDDNTKLAISDYLNSPLLDSEKALQVVEKNYKRQGKSYLKKNYPNLSNRHSYHLIPKEVTPLENPKGLAPGLLTTLEGKNNKTSKIFSLPGVPGEFKAMLKDVVLPLITPDHIKLNPPPAPFICRTKGIAEEKIFNELCPKLWEELSEFGKVHSYPQAGGIDIEIEPIFYPEPIDELLEQIKKLFSNSPLAPFIWSFDKGPVESLILSMANLKGIKISLSESCTGGLISSLLTNIPGSSNSFLGSLICYSNQAKIQQLEVSPLALEKNGAVSKIVALQMAKGSRKLFSSHIAISTSGIAGPTGGSKEHPVGTLALGWDSHCGSGSELLRLGDRGDREELKNLFAKKALFKLFDLVKEYQILPGNISI